MSLVRRIIVTVFILFNFLTFFRVFMPLDTVFFQSIYRPIDSYLSFFSIYQDWLMFAPDPSKINSYITGEVEFEDGSKDTYTFPRSEEMSLLEKYQNGEKYRKILSEGVRKDSNQFMWKDTAKFVLKKLKDKHGYKLPLRVKLYRHWDEIKNLSVEFRPVKQKPQTFQSYNFFTYEVGE